MARFFIECPHTDEDCVQTLDSVLGHSESLLARFDWGCKAGEHTGWVVIEAQDPETALMLLPTTIREDAKAVEIAKFSAEEVKAYHQH